MNLTVNTYLALETDRATKRLQHPGGPVRGTRQLQQRWAEQLYQKVDGSGLRGVSSTPRAHRWLQEPTKLITGRNFQAIKIRINALPTRSRTARGRPTKDRLCRAGCGTPETVNHVLQQCPRTHGSRIWRHDAAVSYLARNMVSRKYEVYREPLIRTKNGNLKPDLVGKIGDRLVVLDAQVVTGSIDLRLAHNTKIQKYSGQQFLNKLQNTYQADVITVLSATLNWRGIWSADSAEGLLMNGILRTTDLAILATRTLQGSSRAWTDYNKSTMTFGGEDTGGEDRPPGETYHLRSNTSTFTQSVRRKEGKKKICQSVYMCGLCSNLLKDLDSRPSGRQ